jgi:hypothetical protein
MNARKLLVGSIASALLVGASQSQAMPPGAAPLPVSNPGFDIGGNPYAVNWLDPVSQPPYNHGNGGQGTEPRSLSTPNMLTGTSGQFATGGVLQWLATDHNNVAGTQLRYDQFGIYSLSAFAFSSPAYAGTTFKLQFLANPLPATRPGSIVVAEQMFASVDSTDSSGGGVLAPDGVTWWHEHTFTFAASNSPSIWGQYISIQIAGTQGDTDVGAVNGYYNADNVSGWFIPEPSTAMLLLAGTVLLWRRRVSQNG